MTYTWPKNEKIYFIAMFHQNHKRSAEVSCNIFLICNSIPGAITLYQFENPHQFEDEKWRRGMICASIYFIPVPLLIRVLLLFDLQRRAPFRGVERICLFVSLFFFHPPHISLTLASPRSPALMSICPNQVEKARGAQANFWSSGASCGA